MQQQQQSGIDVVVQGRIVWGGVKVREKVNYVTKQPVLDDKGQPVKEWAFGLAIPKPGPHSQPHEVENFMKVWNAIHTEAARLGVQQGNDKFHWKYEDGDGMKDGQPYPQHSRGHIILACKTNIPLKLMVWEGQNCRQATEEEIECGYYVQAALNIRAHNGANNSGVNAGLYINPSFVARFAFGEKIVNSVDPKTILGNAPPSMFAGASATPVGPVGNIPGMPMGGQGQANQYPGPAAAPQQQFGGAPAQQPGYQPNYGVLPQHLQPQGGSNQAAPTPQFGGVPAGNGAQPQVAQGFPAATGGQGYPQNGFGNGSYPAPGPQAVPQGAPAQQPGYQPNYGVLPAPGFGYNGQ